MKDKIVKYDSGSGFRRLVPGWDSLSISGEVVIKGLVCCSRTSLTSISSVNNILLYT